MRRRRRFRDSWDGSYFPPKSSPLPADGIKARSVRGEKFVESWWANKWIAALERIVDKNRLQRGRRYARKGQVIGIDFRGTQVNSKVQGSRPTPYSVSIFVAPLSDAEWQRAIEVMASRAIYAAKLLAGDMPSDIEAAFSSAGLSLFPVEKKDLRTDCSCPDWANPCKHVSAVYYLLGERFDGDPFLLFQLRGRSKEQVVQELRARRGAIAGPKTAEQEGAESTDADAIEDDNDLTTLDGCIETFWVYPKAGPTHSGAYTPPSIDAASIKQLGTPAFWRTGDDFVKSMAVAYRSISDAAVAIVFGERER